MTRDPELRSTQSGISVCSFTVAVNKRQRKDQNGNQPEADFFNVTAWRELGENCAKYLAKGRKVCVVGPVGVRMYDRRDGGQGARLEVTADDVEFLTPKSENSGDYHSAAPQEVPPEPVVDAQSGMQQVESDELPF